MAVSALCNAMNTITLGLMALMRFESKSSLHTQGACTLQSLKVQQLELRDKLQLSTRLNGAYPLDGLTATYTSCQPRGPRACPLSPRGAESPRGAVSECFRAYTAAPGGVVKPAPHSALSK